MVVHERPVGATVEWYTPPELFDALGLRFDLDPAAGSDADHAEMYSSVPCDARYTAVLDGLSRDWRGRRVWLNPPYGKALPAFVDKMCANGNGIMLAASRTETRWWQQAAHSAASVCFLRDRLHFIRGDDGYQARSSFASTLFAWGDESVEALGRANLGWTVTMWPYVERLSA